MVGFRGTAVAALAGPVERTIGAVVSELTMPVGLVVAHAAVSNATDARKIVRWIMV
jgi:hypothetical protein